ncbi:MAG: hypothetical protein L0Y72_11710 [Gemmataceae bacterium]|nr:hypothetical protein [Gemmataceae bacterium]MCI0739701.1 hypothetical protein [Gemmataceae bacterium]
MDAPLTDALVFPVWFGVNLALGLAAWKVSHRLFPSDGILATLGHALVLSWATIVLAAIVLGLAYSLTGFALLGVVGVIALATLILLRRFSPRPCGGEGSGVRDADGWWLLLWGAVFAFWLSHSIVNGVMQFPTDWDTLNYHLPMIVQWIHAQSLYAPDCFHWSYPGNNELLGFWLVAPFSGDFFIGLNNLPAAVLLATQAVQLGLTLGLSRGLAHLAAFAVVSNFVVLNQLTNAENDVAAAALFLACLHCGFRFASSPTRAHKEEVQSRSREEAGNSLSTPLPDGRGSDLLYFAISLGLLAGVKYYALGYAAVAGIAIMLLTLFGTGRRAGLSLALIGAAGLLLFAGYWYARNWVVTGRPLYPKSFDTETDLISKMYPDVANTSFLGNGRPELVGLTIEAVWKMAGPIHVAALVTAPLLAVGFMVLGIRGYWRRGDANNLRNAVLGFVLTSAALVWLTTPFAVEDQPGTLNQMHWHYCPVRYGFVVLSLSILALFLFGSLWVRTLTFLRLVVQLAPSAAILAIAIQIYTACKQTAQDWETVMAGTANLAFWAGNLFLGLSIWPKAKPIWPLLMLVASGLGAPLCAENAAHWHRRFSAFYDRRQLAGVSALMAAETAETERICVLETPCYPYFGSKRQFQLFQPTFIPSAEWFLRYCGERNGSLLIQPWGGVSESWLGSFQIEARIPLQLRKHTGLQLEREFGGRDFFRIVLDREKGTDKDEGW